MRFIPTSLLVGLLMLSSCLDHRDLPTSPDQLQVQPRFATGLVTPIGLTTDAGGRVWVSEVGTGNNDGAVSVIDSDGTVNRVITGFPSVIFDDSPAGLTHLTFHNGLLYILHGASGRLYTADVSGYSPGSPPIPAASLTSYDLGTFVRDYDFADDTNESNLYSLTVGPDGALYITDAAANAIIRRALDGTLSMFATVPSIANPTPVGPPFVQAVPTGIVFDGQKFLVTTLLGFPFPTGHARIHQIGLAGNVSLYRDGFTMLVDVVLDAANQPVVVEFAQFGPSGFTPATGRVVGQANGQNTPLLTAQNFPVAIARSGPRTYYVANLVDGVVQKVTY